MYKRFNDQTTTSISPFQELFSHHQNIHTCMYVCDSAHAKFKSQSAGGNMSHWPEDSKNITVICQGGCFQIHKAVLATCSSPDGQEFPQVRKFSIIRQDTAYRIKPLVTKSPTSSCALVRETPSHTGDSEAIQCEKLNEPSSLGIST